MTRIDMTTREWHELIKPVISHVSTDKDLPELGVVRLEIGDSAVYAVATDRYTLAAERSPVTAVAYELWQPVHLSAREVAASLKLFTYSKDDDPPLRITIDTAPIPISVVGQPGSVNHLALTIQPAGDGTRLVLHDERDPSRDPMAGWRKNVHAAMSRPPGHVLDGLDIHGHQLTRWATAARTGERMTLYSGPEPGDPLLITVEKHFAGLCSVQQYLDGPRKTLVALPWRYELGIDEDG